MTLHKDHHKLVEARFTDTVAEAILLDQEHERGWDLITRTLIDITPYEEGVRRSHVYSLAKPRVYVTSQYRCPEWNSVRAWLAGTKEQG